VTVGRLLDGTRVCVVAGSGGVGKTTVSAAIAAGMAARGLSVAVVTIDPAQRLADALGLDELGGAPHRVEAAAFAEAGLPLAGELWAMTLDPKRTFDELIGRLAPDAATREGILGNRVYRELSDAVAGSQEFTAVAAVHELAREGRFDLLVLDTPPSRNALDFLDAPDRLTQFFEGRALQALLRPSGAGMRLLGRGAGLALGLLRRVTGAELLSDLSDFFRLLGGLVGGFRVRAAEVDALLRDSATAFLLVTSPEREPIEEAVYFQRRLHAAGMSLGGAVVNRIHAGALRGGEAADLPARLVAEAGLSLALARQVAAIAAEEQALARRDADNVADLARRLGADVPLVQVPLLDEDVHDAAGLVRLDRHLFDAPPDRSPHAVQSGDDRLP
jgi:anion-transporting  ArsA/GET3 family ATPase